MLGSSLLLRKEKTMEFTIKHLTETDCIPNRGTFNSNSEHRYIGEIADKLSALCGNKTATETYNNALHRMIVKFECLVTNKHTLIRDTNYVEDVERCVKRQNKENSLYYVYLKNTQYDADTDTAIAKIEAIDETLKHMKVASMILSEKSLGPVDVFYSEITNTIVIMSAKFLSWHTILSVRKLIYQGNTKLNKESDQNIKKYFDAVINALLNKDGAEFDAAIKALFKDPSIKERRYDFIEELKINKKETEIETLEFEIRRRREAINEWNRNIITYTNKLREDNQKLLVLLSSPDDNTDLAKLKKHLINNPYITDITKGEGDSTIIITYDAPLTYFDKAILKTLIDGQHFRNDKKRILEAIYSEKFTLWTSCNIILDLRTMHMGTANGSYNYLPHPHIVEYNCFGTHNQALQSWVSSGNYEGMIDQVTATVINLNFTDGVVINNMLNNLTENYKTRKVWETETGVFINTSELLDQLRE